MTPGLIIISLFWILLTTLPFLIAVISLCMKKKPATDGKNAGQGLKKPTSSSMADNKANTGPDKKQYRQMSTDKGTSASQPEKALSPMRPTALSPTPTVGPNKTTDDVADELSKNPKGLSDEARNPPSVPQKTGGKTFGVTQGGPTPVVPASDDKKDAAQSPKPSPGNAPGEKVEPTQKSFQSSKRRGWPQKSGQKNAPKTDQKNGPKKRSRNQKRRLHRHSSRLRWTSTMTRKPYRMSNHWRKIWSHRCRMMPSDPFVLFWMFDKVFKKVNFLNFSL